MHNKAMDTDARGLLAHPAERGSSPIRYVASVWVGRLVMIAAALFAWRAWGWLGTAGIIVYAFALGSWVDAVSRWPSHRGLLAVIRAGLKAGAAGIEGLLLLPTWSISTPN
jgi:hypothetical protein